MKNRRPNLLPARPGADAKDAQSVASRTCAPYRDTGPAEAASSVGPLLEQITNRIVAVSQELLTVAAQAEVAEQIRRMEAIGQRLLELERAPAAKQLAGLAEIGTELDRIRELSRLAVEKHAGPGDTMH